MIDPAGLSASRALDAIARKELSPLDLTRACLARIEQLDSVIQAFLVVDADAALEQARTLTEELAGNATARPLHGIPFGIKDIIDVEGLTTTASSRVLAGNVARSDAPVVELLRAAGCVLLGKTNTQEFAYGVVTAPTSNPWDPERIPGGSSGGSAAAVSAGMSIAALGTDTAGSIRIPSALCGVSGLMPRAGAFAMDGIIPLAPSLDRCGPIARDATDLAVIWSALARHPLAQPAAPGKLRVGAPAAASDIGEMSPAVDDAVERALVVLAGAGTHRVTVELPHLREWDYPRSVPLMVEALTVHRDAGWYPEYAADYEEGTRAALAYAEKLGGDTLASARRDLERLTGRLMGAFESVDVLVLPATPIPAPTKAEASAVDGAHRPPITRSLTRICGPVNWCDLAAVAIPCGFTAEGLPIGLQIVGRSERTVLEVALLYQSLTDWHTRRPDLSFAR
ncbi:MAG: amidase [Actinomycetota bacterium]